MSKSRDQHRFGDFQTPARLAEQAIRITKSYFPDARTIIEPACGTGSFLRAAAAAYPRCKTVFGLDVNPTYVQSCRRSLPRADSAKITATVGNFFNFNWMDYLGDVAGPMLIIGNPPWVTTSDLGAISSANHPRKQNINRLKGIDAVTGKSNFDISEWMLTEYLKWLDNSPGAFAVLCKTAVARKVLRYAHANRVGVGRFRMYRIDAAAEFGVSVEACLFMGQSGSPKGYECREYSALSARKPERTIGYCENILLSDVSLFKKHKGLAGAGEKVWRSGVKHDCAAVMELTREGQRLVNGVGKNVNIEPDFLFPLLKSSDIGNGRTEDTRRFVLVTQRRTGDSTSTIRAKAPRTWRYLVANKSRLDARASTIYRNRPPFSIFGVGDYTFAKWKVAISGFYKHLTFTPVGPLEDRPVIFDDTVYFLPCRTKKECFALAKMLNSKPAREFYESMIFWSDKRPITVEVLSRLSFTNLAKLLRIQKQRRHE